MFLLVIGLILYASHATIAIKVHVSDTCAMYKELLDIAIPTAIARAKLTFDAMSTAKDGDVVDELSWTLFNDGVGDERFIEARDRIGKISALEYDKTTSLWKVATPVLPDTITIFCGFARFVPANGLYYDTPNAIKLSAQSWAEIHSGEVLAATQNIDLVTRGVHKVTATAMNLCEHCVFEMQSAFSRGMAYVFDDESRSLVRLEELAAQGKGERNMPDIDVVNNLLDGTIFHEFSHAFHCGAAEDVKDGASYGWEACINILQPGNADSLTLFAIAVKLHTLGYRIDDQGNFEARAAVPPSKAVKNIVGVVKAVL